MSAGSKVDFEIGQLGSTELSIATGRNQGIELRASFSRFAFPKSASEACPPFGQVSMR